MVQILECEYLFTFWGGEQNHACESGPLLPIAIFQCSFMDQHIDIMYRMCRSKTCIGCDHTHNSHMIFTYIKESPP